MSVDVSKKMMSVIQWIVTIAIFFSIIYLREASSEFSDGVTQRIIVSLPASDCTHPSCFTWSECLVDPSQCFSSHSNVTLLPGEYLLHQYLLVRDVESLSIYGGVPVSGSARDNQVEINCNYTAGGIGFFNVTDFVLSGITLVSCGASGADIASELSNEDTVTVWFLLDNQMVPYYYALHVIDGINVSLKRVFITNSTQIGLLCINVLGTSHIKDSVFTYSNYRLLEDYMRGEVRCSDGELDCVGTNVWVFLMDDFYTNCTKVDFTISRAEISYGVNLMPSSGALIHWGIGSGVGITLMPLFRYEAHHSRSITISNCSFRNNFGEHSAHLGIEIQSNSSVLVKDCSFTYANRINNDLVRAFYPGDIISIQVIVPELEFTFVINITVTVRNVSITDNFGVGLSVYTDIAPHITQANIHTMVKDMRMTKNYFWFVLIGLIEQRSYPGSLTHMITSLESVEISNNQIVVFEDETARDSWYGGDLGCLVVMETVVRLNQTEFYNNTCSLSAVFSRESDLHFHGVNIFRNNTGVCGGALSLNIGSLMYLHPGTQIYIIENTGLKYGGGICVDNGIVKRFVNPCFYQIMDPEILNDNNTFVYMEGNRAAITGYSIFGGSVYNCEDLLTYDCARDKQMSIRYFEQVFHLSPPNISLSSWYEVSSEPVMVCFCFNQSKQPLCHIDEMATSAYPGQTIKVWAVGIGWGSPYGIVPTIVRSRTDSQYNIFPEVQSLGNACEPLNYTVLAPEGVSGITVMITVEGSPIADSVRHLIIDTLYCPQGFVLQQSECGCHPMLQQVSVECEIDTRTFTRLGSVWIGMDSENKGLLTHMHCPNAYCKLQQVEFELDTPDAQCASDHSGILCGGCKDGFALMLGSSRCDQCDNKHLALLLTFIAAGLLLVLILGRVDITVASGTMNGVLFYTNVVKASRDAFISSFVSKHFTIIMAWLNLDLGIEVCFSNHLDMFRKSLLQFAFPLYIWLLVAGIIVLSRYSTVAARLSGRNAVPVLATLFLLSYAKVLDTIIAAFSFTSIEAEKNGPLVVWLHDGNLKYMQGKHIALVLVSSLFAIFYIIPLTLLLLFAPALQRISHYRVVRLVQRLKPILDAFQGPYKDKFRWWPGLMLVMRIVLFIALTANTTHDPRRSVLLVALAVSTLITVGLIWSGGVYNNKLLIGLETALNSNLLIFAMWSLFNYSAYRNKAELSKHQQAAAYTMISIFYALLATVLFYHIAKKLTDLGIPGCLMNFIRKHREHREPQGDGEGEEIKMRGRQDSGCAPVALPPTVTIVDLRELREPLLTD